MTMEQFVTKHTMISFHNFLNMLRQVNWTRRVPRAQAVMEDQFMQVIFTSAIYRALLLILRACKAPFL